MRLEEKSLSKEGDTEGNVEKNSFHSTVRLMHRDLHQVPAQKKKANI